MKIYKVYIIAAIAAIAAIVLMSYFGAHNRTHTPGGMSVATAQNYAGESIRYLIKPSGDSEYKNFGMVDLKGVKKNLLTLKTNSFFIKVMEKIYSDADTLLPYRTERTTAGLWIKEYRTEEYDQEQSTVVIRKYENGRYIKEKILKAKGPIQNVNVLLLYLRKQPDLKIGWHCHATVPDELTLFGFELKLVSVDEITVPAGKFQAYHFVSTPAKYEIWLDTSSARIPLKLKLKSVIDCSLSMNKYGP